LRVRKLRSRPAAFVFVFLMHDHGS
jgi:hypothetical protein